MNYNFAQSFYVDPAAIANSSIVFLTSVDLFFKTLPNPINNATGIVNPGVQIYLANMANNSPDTNNVIMSSKSRLEFSDIVSSNNSSQKSTFYFKHPIPVSSGKGYAILVKYDDPGFDVWKSVQGDRLVGTNDPFSGPTGKLVGQYYESNSNNNWSAVSTTDLMFRLNIAKFTANSATFELVHGNYEFLTLNAANGIFSGGEIVYQEMHKNGPGTISIQNGNNVVIGTGTTFTSEFQSNTYFVVRNGANDVVRQVSNVVSDTQMTVYENMPYTNTVAKYSKTVVGQVFRYNPLANNLILNLSNANDSVRFATQMAANLTITGGTGYANTDTIVVYGANASLNAVANLTTNSTGGIISYNFSNNGLGFTSGAAANTKVANSTGGTSAGSGATIVVSTGFKIKGAYSGATANIVTIDNLDSHAFNSTLYLGMTTNSKANLTYDMAYANGGTYVVDDGAQIPFVNQQQTNIPTYNAIIMSKSNEVLNANNLHDTKSSFLSVAFTTNENVTDGIYDAPFIYNKKLNMDIYTNVINNDQTNENTRYGNAYAKHLTTKIAFANGMLAEDIVVFADVYQPPGTKIAAYAKIYNSHDSDAFDDKDWSPLQVKDGVNALSSLTNQDDLVELTFGFPQYPETKTTLAGTVTTTNNSSTVTGSGTDFTTLTQGQLVKIYQPLFPLNYQIAPVSSITNTTSMVIGDVVLNNNVLGSGLAIDSLKYNHTVFNNALNENVCRYYNSNLNVFDGYDTMALKFDLLSTNVNLAPKIKEIRAIGVSA